jgi:hypothetical protein
MNLFGDPPAEENTARIEAVNPRCETRILRRITLLSAFGFMVGICLIVDLCLLLDDGVRSPVWRLTASISTLAAITLFGVALLRDWIDGRLAMAETRSHGRMQAEVYRIEKRLDVTDKLISDSVTRTAHELAEVSRQTALMRAELVALLGGLPEGIVTYGNGRATDGQLAALREFAATGTEEAGLLASVSRLHAVEPRRN